MADEVFDHADRFMSRERARRSDLLESMARSVVDRFGLMSDEEKSVVFEALMERYNNVIMNTPLPPQREITSPDTRDENVIEDDAKEMLFRHMEDTKRVSTESDA